MDLGEYCSYLLSAIAIILHIYLNYRWLGITAHLLSLFFVVVVLQSLLIAQMNHTYSNIQQEADAQLILDRARSIIFIQRAVAGLPGMVCTHKNLNICNVLCVYRIVIIKAQA